MKEAQEEAKRLDEKAKQVSMTGKSNTTKKQAAKPAKKKPSRKNSKPANLDGIDVSDLAASMMSNSFTAKPTYHKGKKRK